ncbi:hypothetical protein JW998_03950 [candidate division KSB1 bacterium]|nr:hypothetical protein [candidate division KSB1 bacterium]
MDLKFSRIFVISIVLLTSVSTQAQVRRGSGPRTGYSRKASDYRLEITPFWGYQMGGKTYYSGGDLNIVDSQVYGIQVGVPTPLGATAEFFYSHQPTRMDAIVSPPFEPAYSKTLFDFGVDYYLVGLLRPLQAGQTETFGVVYLGAANMRPADSKYTDEWFFTAGLGGGVKARFNPRAGLRLQARLLMPMQLSGAGLWCGTGGCDIGVGASSTILQLDLNAGIIIYL